MTFVNMDCNEPSRLDKYKIKESVDVYLMEDGDGFRLQFYKINTRQKLTIKADKEVANVLSLLNGGRTLSEVLYISQVDESDFYNFVKFLIDNGILKKCSKGGEIAFSDDYRRFSRQINYFDDLITGRSGIESQKILNSSHVAIWGVGAIGGALAIQLVRAGVGGITLYDHKVVQKSHRERHHYYKDEYVGLPKVEALKDYLKRIDKQVRVDTSTLRLTPASNLIDILPPSLDLVINTADEPYIGHTTIKLGRHLWRKNIALYIAGGFDAHLMSTGEFVIPGETPCVDCYSLFFKRALKGWKPEYYSSLKEVAKVSSPVWNYDYGGAGGLGSQALFSSSYGCINIINYLLGNELAMHKKSNRGEYLVNSGKMTWFDLAGANGCELCGA